MDDIKIGLEVHVGLKTRSKLFCSCSRGVESDRPNSKTCVVCLGMPGSKPVLNRSAFDFALKIALALGCKISSSLVFSRKTYFYPDLAKNFQITQFEEPLGSSGCIVLSDGSKIGISRVHIEEDPASLIHEASSVLIDYNRSGNPLVEIVTSPALTSPSQARELLNKLVVVLKYLDIFDDSCVLKADANISIKKHNFSRVEIKNVTGFKEIERALSYEAKRQEVDDVVPGTYGWDAVKGVTYFMRSKEAEDDYGYIYEPDIPSFKIDSDIVDSVVLPELPDSRIERFVNLGVDPVDSQIIVSDKKIADVFDLVIRSISPGLAGKWFRRDVLKIVNSNQGVSLNPSALISLLRLVEFGEITDKTAQHLFPEVILENLDPVKFVKENDLLAVSSASEVEGFCKKVIEENSKAIDDFKSGEEKSFNFLVGQVMKLTKGKAKPEVIRDVLMVLLKKV